MRHTAVAAVLLVAAYRPTLVRAWHDEGHLYASLAAVEALPADVPPFFRDGAKTIAHLSIDPDVYRNKLTPQLADATSPDHFIDLEYLEGVELPGVRSAFVKLCQERGLDPQRVGYLPYAIVEGAQRLALAFAEHRRYPDNAHVKLKCLVYAGLLSHFTADLHMPLHTTLHYNGRRPRNADGTWGRAERPGIHARVDALPTWLAYHTIFPPPPESPLALREVDGELMAFILSNLADSHALVDRTYELESKLPADGAAGPMDGEVRAFTIDRERAAARFTGEVFLYAWRLSARLQLDDWLDRTTLDQKLDRDAPPPQPPPAADR